MYQKFMKRNDCYKQNRRMLPMGIMVHSTGANNPKISRYTDQPNGWNRPDYEICAHAVIGLNDRGEVDTCQTLPFDMVGWHAGGRANKTFIGFEICEDDLTNPDYFNQVYNEAVRLCVLLCGTYGINVKNIICHSEGHKFGIASNHADVMHWFPKFGKSMDTFRNDVRKAMETVTETHKEDVTGMKRFNTIEEVPKWYQDAVAEYVASGCLSGNAGGKLDLSEDMCRVLTIVQKYLKKG